MLSGSAVFMLRGPFQPLAFISAFSSNITPRLKLILSFLSRTSIMCLKTSSLTMIREFSIKRRFCAGSYTLNSNWQSSTYGSKKSVRLKAESRLNCSFSAIMFSKVLLPEPFPPQKIVISENCISDSCFCRGKIWNG